MQTLVKARCFSILLIFCLCFTSSSPLFVSTAQASQDSSKNGNFGYNRSDWRRGATMVLGTVVGALFGLSTGGVLGLAIGGVGAYFLSRLVAKDLFPTYDPYAHYRSRHSFQRGERISVGPLAAEGTVEAKEKIQSKGDVEVSYEKYRESLQLYQDSLKEGIRAKIDQAREKYLRARSKWLKARGVEKGPAQFAR